MSETGPGGDHSPNRPRGGAEVDDWATDRPAGGSGTEAGTEDESGADDESGTFADDEIPGVAPAGTQSASTEPAGTEPAGTQSASTEPAGTEPAGTEPASGEAASMGQRPPRTRRRRAAYAALRAAVVLVVAGAGYQAVVPSSHVERTRLSKLVLTKTGVASYDKVKVTASAQDDTGTQIAALSAAAKKYPDKTGLYLADWSVSDQIGAEIIGLLLPTEASATTALGQIKAQQMAAGSYTSDQLSRASTFTVPGVPGASGSLYRTTAKTAGAPDVVVTAFRQGRMIGFTQLAGASATAQRDAESITNREYAQLESLGTGLNLSVIRRSTVATILWAIGAVLLAALAALVPVARRWRAERRRRDYEEEMAHRVVVGSQVINKYHRARPRP